MVILDQPKRWRTQRVNVFWDGHRDLPYVNEPFNDPDSLSRWRHLGYTQEKFTGDMYDMRQPEPSWMQPFRDIFNWKHFSWSLYRMGPGTVLPMHQDLYVRFREIYQIKNAGDIVRAIVFLEDWQSGHYFEIDNHPVVSWSAGDTVIWHNDVPHLAANMGQTDRYTLQITGVLDANQFVE